MTMSRIRRAAFRWALSAAGFVLAGSLGHAGESLVISDFESKAALKPFDKHDAIEIVSDHATQGKHAAKLAPGFTLHAAAWRGMPANWCSHDRLIVDLFNPGRATSLTVWISDNNRNSYWDTFNQIYDLPTGAGRLIVPLRELYRGDRASGRLLDLRRIQEFKITFTEKAGQGDGFFVDNLHLACTRIKTEEKMLIGFEKDVPGAKWEIDDSWPENKPGKSSIALVPDHHTEGKVALRMDHRKEGSNVTFTNLSIQDWSGHDALWVDCFNPSDRVVRLSGWFKDATGESYNDRHNYDGFKAKRVLSGKSIIKFRFRNFTRATFFHVADWLNMKQIRSFCLGAADARLYFDNIRLVREMDPDFQKQVLKPRPSGYAHNLGKETEIDADAAKVLVLSDFETESEVHNFPLDTTQTIPKAVYGKHPVWYSRSVKANWANWVERSQENVFHGRYALKVYSPTGGHGFAGGMTYSFPRDWSEYDAVRFFVHWPYQVSQQFVFGLRLFYTDDKGKQEEIWPFLIYYPKPGYNHIEIPLSAFSNPEWNRTPGGLKGIMMPRAAGGDYKKARKYKFGNFKNVFGFKWGNRGSQGRHCWIDYMRLVKKKAAN